MNTIMNKKYNSPMLQVVGIKSNDIIVTSTTRGLSEVTVDPSLAESPGRRNVFDEWYEGY